MTDLEKVIKGFECCHVMVHDLGPSVSSCGICPYKDVQTEEQIDLGGIECVAVLHDDALELLKEQAEQIATIKMIYGGDAKIVGEIVRCKDCKHWKRRECGSYGTCESENMNIAGFFDADWFCADGERR